MFNESPPDKTGYSKISALLDEFENDENLLSEVDMNDLALL